jgi:hypothetical protein
MRRARPPHPRHPRTTTPARVCVVRECSRRPAPRRCCSRGPESRMRRACPSHPRLSRVTTGGVAPRRCCSRGPESRMRRACPSHPRRSRATTRASEQRGPSDAKQTRAGIVAQGVADEAGVPVSSATRALRPRHRRGEERPASAHITDFPCGVWRARGPRIRSDGAAEGRDGARTFAALEHARPRKANSGKMPACAQPMHRATAATATPSQPSARTAPPSRAPTRMLYSAP